MFTGLIRQTGIVRSFSGGHLSVGIAEKEFLKNTVQGDSICVNGVCLSFTEITEKVFKVFVSDETVLKTNLSLLQTGSRVNLEMPLRLSDLLHGHLVQGHVDGTGLVEDLFRQGGGWVLKICFPKDISGYIVSKGSIAVNGVSLTVAKKAGLIFDVAVIPETIEHTNLGVLRKGDRVNLETDLIGKYVKSLMSSTVKQGKI